MTEQKKGSICAVVVTYNRKQLLLECLESLLKQTYPLDAIYLIDNTSSDGTPEILKERGYINELLMASTQPLESENAILMLSDGNKAKPVTVNYVRMHENTGGAGGFYEGVKRGYEKGYDWLWLMDDDCFLDQYALKEQILRTDKTIVTAPLKIVKGTSKYVSTFKCDRLDSELHPIKYTLAFNGFLISKTIVKTIGLPRKEYFLDRDDTEYCLRLKKQGFALFIVPTARLYHPDDYVFSLVVGKVCLLKINNFPNSPKRIYYRVRNSIWICRIYPNVTPDFIKSLIKIFVALAVYFNSENMVSFLRGCIDGLVSRLNEPEII